MSARLDPRRYRRPRHGEFGHDPDRGDADCRPLDGATTGDIITARPTDDETINEFGRRIAMIPDDDQGDSWSSRLALNV